MDRYMKVEQKKKGDHVVPIKPNEIRITSQGLVRNYISYATTLLQERREKDIVLKAMGQAISKTVSIAEIIKKNISRLHQDTNICSISITDIWEPIEEGLLPVEMTRQVSMISITLSTKELNQNSPGYQAPLYVERPRPQYNNYRRQQPQQAYNGVNEEPYDGSYNSNRDHVQGGGVRGGRGRGWNRGGYGNQRGGYESYQDGDGYRNHQEGGGYGSYRGGRGYGNYRGGRGYGNYQGGGDGEYGNYQDDGVYGNNQGKNGYSNGNRGDNWENAGYRGQPGGGYMRGGGGRGGGGGRFNARGRRRMGRQPRDGGDPQQQ